MHSQTNLDSTYKKALDWTDPSHHKIPEVGSEQERLMLKRVEDLYTNYTYENLQNSFPNVYAETVYFRDAFKHYKQLDELMAYMLKGVQAVSGVKFAFNHIMPSKGEFFIEWTMSIQFKEKDSYESSMGMSRFGF